MTQGLKNHQVAGLVNALRDEIAARWSLPQMLRQIISGVVMDFLGRHHLLIDAQPVIPAAKKFDFLTEEAIRMEFERQHAGRALNRGHRGTYQSPQIAALWNQHLRTIKWMTGTNDQTAPPHMENYCTGGGISDCVTCLYNQNWKTMNELSNMERIDLQLRLPRINERICVHLKGRLKKQATVPE